MRIADVIEMVDRILPNQIENDVKEEWVKSVEGQLWDEVILTHYGAPEKMFSADEANGGTELIAKPPYSDLYRFYLEAQINLADGEMTRYNNAITMFNTSWMTFRNYYNRKHMPVEVVKDIGFTQKGGTANGPLT